jgi:hypothetical protein
MVNTLESTSFEIKKIEKKINEPYKERMEVAIQENKGIVKGKKFTQYRIAIPKKFADFMELNKADFNTEVALDRKNKILTIEINKK